MSVNMFWLSWCPVTESNCQYLITKQVLCHLTNRAKNLVDRERVELSISGCKPDVFPLALTAQSNIQLISLYTVC